MPRNGQKHAHQKSRLWFFLSDFDVSFLTSISASTVILTLGKVEVFK